MTVSEAKWKIPSTEFLCWCKIIEDEWNEKKKEDFYSARLAYQVYLLRWTVANMFNKDAKEPAMEEKDFFVTFTSGTSEKPIIESPTVEKEQSTDMRPPSKDDEIVGYTKDGRPMNAEQKKYVEEQRAIWLAALDLDENGKMKGPIRTRLPPEPGETQVPRNNPIIKNG